jgi:hypothetical protein
MRYPDPRAASRWSAWLDGGDGAAIRRARAVAWCGAFHALVAGCAPEEARVRHVLTFVTSTVATFADDAAVLGASLTVAVAAVRRLRAVFATGAGFTVLFTPILGVAASRGHGGQLCGDSAGWQRPRPRHMHKQPRRRHTQPRRPQPPPPSSPSSSLLGLARPPIHDFLRTLWTECLAEYGELFAGKALELVSPDTSPLFVERPVSGSGDGATLELQRVPLPDDLLALLMGLDSAASGSVQFSPDPFGVLSDMLVPPSPERIPVIAGLVEPEVDHAHTLRVV